jgi:hypothetical protein
MVCLLVVCLRFPASLTTIQRGKDDAIDHAAERQRLAYSIAFTTPLVAGDQGAA